jgi:HAD superfamily hydrolase (TIGR01484 family)
MPPFSTLATDLDGTFLPLPTHPENRAALARLKEAFASPARTLIFATGRHLESIEAAIEETPLPRPDWIIADVGVTIHRRADDGWQRLAAYEEYLHETVDGHVPQTMDRLFASLPGLRRQPAINQKPFKLSYQCEPAELPRLTHAIEEILAERDLPLNCTSSVDPEGRTGLLDLLPAAAGKCAALFWLLEETGLTRSSVIFSGDSGNDRSALTSDLHVILVGNAPPSLAEQVRLIREAQGQAERLYLAKGVATSGVLEGCRHYGLVD